MKSKPYGIFEITEGDAISVSNVKETLDRLLVHIDEGRKGNKEGVWSWDEVVGGIWCYVAIMKKELEEKSALEEFGTGKEEFE